MSSSQTATPLPALPTAQGVDPLRVVVLTCSAAGWEAAHALYGAAGARVVGVVQTPLAKPKSLRARLRNVYRYHGLAGIMRIPFNQVRTRRDEFESARRATPTIPLLRFRNFHDDDCLAALAALRPDLAVVDGTYMLRESVFLLPRYGSINLHCGRLPDYRGAPPAFWELYNGEREVGVTVHRVTAKLDEGPILQQEHFPIDPAPAGDPLEYVNRVWLEVLRPNGLRMIAESVRRVAAGTSVERPQGRTSVSTYRRPDVKATRELRARLRARRTEAAARPAP